MSCWLLDLIKSSATILNICFVCHLPKLVSAIHLWNRSGGSKYGSQAFYNKTAFSSCVYDEGSPGSLELTTKREKSNFSKFVVFRSIFRGDSQWGLLYISVTAEFLRSPLLQRPLARMVARSRADFPAPTTATRSDIANVSRIDLVPISEEWTTFPEYWETIRSFNGL